jgi:hypothetical protein
MTTFPAASRGGSRSGSGGGGSVLGRTSRHALEYRLKISGEGLWCHTCHEAGAGEQCVSGRCESVPSVQAMHGRRNRSATSTARLRLNCAVRGCRWPRTETRRADASAATRHRTPAWHARRHGCARRGFLVFRHGSLFGSAVTDTVGRGAATTGRRSTAPSRAPLRRRRPASLIGGARVAVEPSPVAMVSMTRRSPIPTPSPGQHSVPPDRPQARAKPAAQPAGTSGEFMPSPPALQIKSSVTAVPNEPMAE